MTDWRLQGQEKYLRGAVLERKACQPYRPEWAHDHCEFCSAEFSLDTPGALREGMPRQTSTGGCARTATATSRICWVGSSSHCPEPGARSLTMGATNPCCMHTYQPPSSGAWRESVVLAYIDEPPFAKPGPDNAAVGCDVELAVTILRAIGVQCVETHLTTFSELIPGVAARRWDINVLLWLGR